MRMIEGNKLFLVAGSMAALCFTTLSCYAQMAPAPPAPAHTEPAPYSGNRAQSIKDGVQIETPYREDVVAMEDAIPTKAPATPKQPRKVLVLCKAAGYVHSSIPLAAATVKAMGEKTGAYSTTITYDSADITAANLAQYDAIFLDSTTLAFLDDPNDAAATAARKKALLDFVRGGKGLVGIHAAVDSYHTAEHGDAPPTGTWPEFNKMIGGYFKFHWVYPQVLTVKIDDPKSPLDAMFHGQEFQIHDETYTMVQDSFSRKNVHVLTSVDYAKMSDEDKAKEKFKRTDGDYALSWIHREGKGRVFVEVLGHSEHIYSNTLMMEHVLAGIQYALGDLKADDSPSEK
jgi:type 1 glutamine amidotransferase